MQHTRELLGREIEVTTDGLAILVVEVEAQQHLAVARASHPAQRRFYAGSDVVFDLSIASGVVLERVERRCGGAPIGTLPGGASKVAEEVHGHLKDVSG